MFIKNRIIKYKVFNDSVQDFDSRAFVIFGWY